MTEPSPTSSRSTAEDAPRVAVTDSPWFWLLLFSLMALVAVQVMAPKYGQRQAQLERQYQGHQWSHFQSDSEHRQKQEVIAFSSADHVVIGLRPLKILAMAVAALSGVMLLRGWPTRRAKE